MKTLNLMTRNLAKVTQSVTGSAASPVSLQSWSFKTTLKDLVLDCEQDSYQGEILENILERK